VKKYPKIVQCDKRGQIVIPKDIRRELNIDEGEGFYMFSINDEGILLKKIPLQTLDDNKEILDEIIDKSDKIGISASSIEKAKKDYEKTKEGGLDLV